MTKNLISGVKISGNYAYVATGDNGLVIVDVTNPSSPTFKGKYYTSGSIYSIAVSGNYAYAADFTKGLLVIDISNSFSPVLKGSYNTLDTDGIVVSGNYAYIANSGLVIVNISNSSSPIVEGGFSSSWGILDVSISGSNVYVADSNNGILVLKANLEQSVTSVMNSSLTQPENNTQSLKQENESAVANVKQKPEQKKETRAPSKESKKTPGFELICGIVSLLTIFYIKGSNKR